VADANAGMGGRWRRLGVCRRRRGPLTDAHTADTTRSDCAATASETWGGRSRGMPAYALTEPGSGLRRRPNAPPDGAGIDQPLQSHALDRIRSNTAPGTPSWRDASRCHTQVQPEPFSSTAACPRAPSAIRGRTVLRAAWLPRRALIGSRHLWGSDLSDRLRLRGDRSENPRLGTIRVQVPADTPPGPSDLV